MRIGQHGDALRLFLEFAHLFLEDSIVFVVAHPYGDGVLLTMVYAFHEELFDGHRFLQGHVGGVVGVAKATRGEKRVYAVFALQQDTNRKH